MEPEPMQLADDPVEKARAAGLAYVSDEDPGIHRRRCGRGFTYLLADGGTLRDPDERERIEALAIPPGWEDVWICLRADGHLQATGRDDRGRKQYRYHERWEKIRDRIKFRRLLVFAHGLPGLRRRVGRDLSRDGLTRARVLAAAVRLLDKTGIRIGNPEYEVQNGSYGLTTLRRRHVEPNGSGVTLKFEGKSGREVSLDVGDAAVAEVLREALEVAGWKALKYLDGNGDKSFVTPDEVNEYIRTVAGGPFTAKDFRTWLGTVTLVDRLGDDDPGDPENRKTAWLTAVDQVADQLANTRSVARESYLPPDLESLYVAGRYHEQIGSPRLSRRIEELSVPGRRRAEPRTIALLEWLLTESGTGE